MATESLSYGGFYFSVPAETPTVADTATKVLGTTSSILTINFTNSINNRIVFNGLIERVFRVGAAFSVSSSEATQIKFYIYKNGVKIVSSEIDRKINTSGDIGALVSLAENDYIELWCETDDGATLTVVSGGLSISVAG